MITRDSRFYRMAVVLSSEESSYFSPSLRRSHSQPKFGAKRSGFHASASTSRIGDIYPDSSKKFAESSQSSTSSSPHVVHAESTDLSCSSTPGTNFSLGSDSECDDDEDDHLETSTTVHLVVPRYDTPGYFNHVEDLEPPPSPRNGHSYSASPNDQDMSTSTSRPGSPDLLERAEDDINIRAQPSRHVDYLSHNWREEDIWSSWKLIVSRRGDYANAARLENASWRTWMKSKNKLSTVSPETLNWFVHTLGILSNASNTIQAQRLRRDMVVWPPTTWPCTPEPDTHKFNKRKAVEIEFFRQEADSEEEEYVGAYAAAVLVNILPGQAGSRRRPSAAEGGDEEDRQAPWP